MMFRQRGVMAGGAAIVAAGALAAVGVAGADERAAPADATVYALDAAGPCFSHVAGKTQCDAGETAEVSVNTGDSVTWDFNASTQFHNAASTNAVPADPGWEPYATPFVNTGSHSRTFDQPGDYTFHCDAHPVMTGTIHVTGTPVTPTPTPPTTTPTPPPTTTPAPPTPTPTTHPGGGGTITPAPGGHTQTDTVRPTVRGLRLKALRHGVRVRFGLSEDATVTIRVKRGSRTLKTVKVQARAGTRTVKVRSSRLKKGRYKVQVRARDAHGNRSSLAAKRLRLRR